MADFTPASAPAEYPPHIGRSVSPTSTNQERQRAFLNIEASEDREQKQQADNLLEQDARFSCSICFDAVTEPVVTQCGHLYCWPCLYRWLSPGMNQAERSFLGIPQSARAQSTVGVVDESRRTCPVCKSEASARTIVPIYVRSNNVPSVAGTNRTQPPRQPSPQISVSLPLAQSASPESQQQPQISLQAHSQQLQLRPHFSPEDERQDSDALPPQIFRQSANHPVHDTTARSNDDSDDRSDTGTEDMGLTIDGYDDNQNLNSLGLDSNVPTTITAMIPSTAASPDSHLGLGMRQRRGGPGGVTRSESRDEMSTTSTIVPTRPMPSRDRAASNNDNNNNNETNNAHDSPTRNSAITITGTAPTPNHHARATLSYGLVLAMHQTLLNATNENIPGNNTSPGNNPGTHTDSVNGNNNTSSNNNIGQSDLNEFVPSLHYPPSNRDASNSSPTPNSDSDLNLDSDPASTLFLSRLLLGLSLFVLICLLSF